MTDIQSFLKYELQTFLDDKTLVAYGITNKAINGTVRHETKSREHLENIKKTVVLVNEMVKRSNTRSCAGNHFDTTTCFLSPTKNSNVKFNLRFRPDNMFAVTIGRKIPNSRKQTAAYIKPVNELYSRIYTLVSSGWTYDFGCVKDWENERLSFHTTETKLDYYYWDKDTSNFSNIYDDDD